MRPASLDLASLRAAWWTLRAVRRASRQLSDGRLDSVALPRPPLLPASAERGVNGTLRRSKAKCLVQALVRQSWFAAQGLPRDLIVGVTSPGAGFGAHAWLDGDPECHDGDFYELLRRRCGG
jgi:Transglutaminase-like superfamily